MSATGGVGGSGFLPGDELVFGSSPSMVADDAGSTGVVGDIAAGSGRDRFMQHPIIHLLQGGASVSVLEWEADLERRVASFIERHLLTSPPPGPSQVAVDLGEWAEGLECDARSRLGLAAPRHQLA
jgi:hypothetical protein